MGIDSVFHSTEEGLIGFPHPTGPFLMRWLMMQD
jgi:hypothetical protein